MKRYVALIIAIPLSAYAIYSFLNTPQRAAKPIAPIAIDVVPVNSKFAANQKASQPIDMSKAPVTTKNITPEQNPTPEHFDAINKLSDDAKTILKNAKVLPTDLNNEAYIEFDLPTLKALKMGDNFDLAIPQTAETYTAEITNISEASNGDKSIFGQVTGLDGRMHNTVLTVGNDAVYGQFTTANGNYVFESKGKHGWIAAKRDLYKSHIEHDTSSLSPNTQKGIDVFAPKRDEDLTN
ncbi:hypothetical protein V6237_14005 [Pseudoalteromonas carrageenovora]|uniref:hypothetical protein n=1 Tax=Pseudoalteromonas carrageenovora TaxID=227 RepID=UPI00311D3500